MLSAINVRTAALPHRPGFLRHARHTADLTRNALHSVRGQATRPRSHMLLAKIIHLTARSRVLYACLLRITFLDLSRRHNSDPPRFPKHANPSLALERVSYSIQNFYVLVQAVVREHALREHDVVQLPQHILLDVPLHDTRQRGPVLESPRLREPNPSRHRQAGFVFPRGGGLRVGASYVNRL